MSLLHSLAQAMHIATFLLGCAKVFYPALLYATTFCRSISPYLCIEHRHVSKGNGLSITFSPDPNRFWISALTWRCQGLVVGATWAGKLVRSVMTNRGTSSTSRHSFTPSRRQCTSQPFYWDAQRSSILHFSMPRPFVEAFLHTYVLNIGMSRKAMAWASPFPPFRWCNGHAAYLSHHGSSITSDFLGRLREFDHFIKPPAFPINCPMMMKLSSSSSTPILLPGSKCSNPFLANASASAFWPLEPRQDQIPGSSFFEAAVPLHHKFSTKDT